MLGTGAERGGGWGWGAASVAKAPQVSPPVKPAVGAQPRLLELSPSPTRGAGEPSPPPSRAGGHAVIATGPPTG